MFEVVPRAMSQRSQRQAKKRRDRAKKQQSAFGGLHVKAGKHTESAKQDSTLLNEVSITELKAIIPRARKEPLSEQDCQVLLSVSETLHFVTEQLEKKSISIGRLRKLLFGAGTEALKNLVPDDPASDDAQDQVPEEAEAGLSTEPKEKPKGHGRNGAEAYTGAQKVNIPHQRLKPGDPCPDCSKGTVYEMAEPGHRVRVTGQAPLQATVYELQKLRCGLCGKIFTATSPPGIGPDKYDSPPAADQHDRLA